MKPNIVAQHKEKILKAIPDISHYIEKFRAINKSWGGAITSGMIETGCMGIEASRVFAPLIEDMRTTKTKYSEIQDRLVDAIIFEMTQKAVIEITDAAKFSINILKRNLFERTADVGYLATDSEIISFLKLAHEEEDQERITQRAEFVRERLNDYQYEYTVYNEIIILDVEGKVQVKLDQDSTITYSTDPLLAKTQSIDLHQKLNEDKYLETFRQTDLRPGRGNVLIYSQKIEDAESHAALGTLCLIFDFEDEMKSIYKDLNQGSKDMIVAILDDGGNVMSSNDQSILPLATKVQVDLEVDFRILTFKGKTYMVSTVKTSGYEGFYGLTWYGMAMIETETTFRKDEDCDLLDKSMVQKLQNFSKELSTIKKESEDLLDDMKLDSINGQVKAGKFEAKSFVEVLHFVKWIGEEIDGLFSAAIENLLQTIAKSLLNDVQFRAFQGNNIADRNLYERANDVCWWALTPLFRLLLTKHNDHKLTDNDTKALTANLQYINDLYTPYLRLVLTDPDGVVVATSNPPGELRERFVKDGLPKGQEFVGMKLNSSLAHRAMSLTSSSKDYCVSDFDTTPLYGGRHTYIYSTAVRDPQNDNRVVGVIQIVFDAEPQFHAMLVDTLPKDEKKQIVKGSFGILVDRSKKIISSTNSDYPVGNKLPLENTLFQREKGERYSTIVEIDSRSYALGLQVSNGYREYKLGDGYVNDVICMIFMSI